jgi:hypothetical protein
MTPFQKTVLNAMTDRLNHGGAYFAYACGVDRKNQPAQAGRIINGYLKKLSKKGLVKKCFSLRKSFAKYKITEKGLKLINEENKTLFDNVEENVDGQVL